ncbi:OprD family outer membrane porin [Pseudomonas bharatica]|uniref:OprD family outer membrane porin n=1 Tax=Pseudomonas bharatica TaxID=2692112 RepID=UPI0035DFEA20
MRCSATSTTRRCSRCSRPSAAAIPSTSATRPCTVTARSAGIRQHHPLGNEVPTYEFAYTDERSWQARYDYDFAAMGVPGLTAGVRYITGDNVDTGRGFEGKDRERDLDIAYVVQSGVLGASAFACAMPWPVPTTAATSTRTG